jgi:hypothetical protein
MNTMSQKLQTAEKILKRVPKFKILNAKKNKIKKKQFKSTDFTRRNKLVWGTFILYPDNTIILTMYRHHNTKLQKIQTQLSVLCSVL